jgi:hypothetical protein
MSTKLHVPASQPVIPALLSALVLSVPLAAVFTSHNDDWSEFRTAFKAGHDTPEKRLEIMNTYNLSAKTICDWQKQLTDETVISEEGGPAAHVNKCIKDVETAEASITTGPT